MARQDVTYFFCWGITASAKRQHGRLARTPSTSPAPSNGSVRPCLAPPSDVAAIFPSLCPHSGYRYHRCYCFYNTLYAIQTIRHGRSLSPPQPLAFPRLIFVFLLFLSSSPFFHRACRCHHYCNTVGRRTTDSWFCICSWPAAGVTGGGAIVGLPPPKASCNGIFALLFELWLPMHLRMPVPPAVKSGELRYQYNCCLFVLRTRFHWFRN